MRERLLSHLAGYDSQDIGEYLKLMDKEEKEQYISISWVEIARPRCEEHHYVKCIEKRQGKWPRYNRKRGRPIKYTILGLTDVNYNATFFYNEYTSRFRLW
jgi:hypothetical protein